jgi:Entner-Doudoroff aldolase
VAVPTNQTIARIEASRVITILRGDFSDTISRLAHILADAGITAVEATLNSTDPLRLVKTLVAEIGERAVIGAGTVLTADDVSRVADVGAQFIVSPNFNPTVVAQTKRLNLVSVPGCFTPTEVVAALEAGADAIKLFPATHLGPSYVKALCGPLNHVRLVPTGGVTPELAGEYRAAGAWAIGVGSELIGPDLDAIDPRAAAFVSAMRGAS